MLITKYYVRCFIFQTPLSLPTLAEADSDSESSDRGVASTARIEFLQQLRQSEVSEVERPATTTSRGSSRTLSGVPASGLSTSFPAPATQLESSTARERTPTQPDPSPASIGTQTQRGLSLSRGMPGPMMSFLSRETPTAGPSTSAPSRGIETAGTSAAVLSHAPTTPGPSASRGTSGTPPRTLIPSRGIMPTNTSFPSFTSLSSGFLQRVQDVYDTTASTSAGHVTDTPTTLPVVSNMSFARGSTDHSGLPTIPSETPGPNQDVSARPTTVATRTLNSRRSSDSFRFQGRRASRDVTIAGAARRRMSHPMAVRATDATAQPELAATSVTSGGHAIRYYLPTTSDSQTRQSQHPTSSVSTRHSSGADHDVTSTRHITTGATSRTIAQVHSGAPTRQQIVRQQAVVRRPVAPSGQTPHVRPGPANRRSSQRLLTKRSTRESSSTNPPPPPPPPPPPSQPPPP